MGVKRPAQAIKESFDAARLSMNRQRGVNDVLPRSIANRTH